MVNNKYDFLVLGSGLAGLSTALYAAQFGSVGLVTKSSLDSSNSYFAQGGIAAVVSDDDSIECHYQDTLLAGAGLCNKEAVKVLVSDGSERVKELIEMGMEFDKVDGELSLGLEGAHSKNRVLHADGDATGRKIVEFFKDKVVSNKNITILERTFVYKLIVSKNICGGFLGYNYSTKESQRFVSNFTMLATGGTSAIYNRTTNPKSSTGDGIILAYNSGAEISNMEFLQFHPSSLVTETGETYLISEAVRGEGAYLVNSKGERFLFGKHEKIELAPRDFVAYEIYKQSKIPNNKVFLSLSHLNPTEIRKRFSNINSELSKYGLDIASDLIPVSPAAHYMIGGIKSGIDGETSVSNLYVAGEVASAGVHGANRLASNSLLECLVFSKRAVDNSLKNKSTLFDDENTKISFYVDESKEKVFLEKKHWIQQNLMDCVGIIRNEIELLKFKNYLDKIEAESDFEDNEYYSFQLQSIITLSKMMIKSALYRKESRGAHKRSDFPDQDENYLFEIIQQKNELIKIKNINNMKVITETEIDLSEVEHLIDLALNEDIKSGDLTTENLIAEDKKVKAYFKAKAGGIIAGLFIAEKVFKKLDSNIIWKAKYKDGAHVKKGDVLVEFSGSYRAILMGERTALNFVQRMSGVATKTSEFVKAIHGTKSQILDTRKTLPAYRMLDKYSVKMGGGTNHRIGLFDMVMIKDNHIKVAKGITNAVNKIRAAVHRNIKIEVETTNMAEVEEAINCNVDIIMLDNMSNEEMKNAVDFIAGRAFVEASGNVNIERVKSIAETGVDFISIGALTHSVCALDIGQYILD